ncbi:l-ascorbate oxidase-like protein [Hordeum vulgare]|nr:l-ascorbate oxidase-like protein [Hordeum vulgare]
MRSTTPASPPSPRLGGHSDGTTLEFVVELHVILRGHLHLPCPFSRAMEAARPPVLWLRAHGCSHDAMQGRVQYAKRHSMLLRRGWKAFARSHNLEDGHILRFKLAVENMLSVKFYGRTSVRLCCCEEGPSGESNRATSTGRATVVMVSSLVSSPGNQIGGRFPGSD